MSDVCLGPTTKRPRLAGEKSCEPPAGQSTSPICDGVGVGSETPQEPDQTEQGVETSIPLGEDGYLPKGVHLANQPTVPEYKALDDVILRFMSEHEVPGLSLVISQKGQVLYTQTYGYATHGTLLRPHHKFRIASVSKIITAVGVLRLQQDNQLKLSDRVFGPKGLLREYSPTPPGDRRVYRITIRHLLQHSAGWDRDEVGDPVFWRHVGAEMEQPEPITNATLIRYMMGQKLQFTPGSRYAYSNFGYIVLGRVIERVSGLSYGDYIHSLLRDIGLDDVRLGRSFREDALQDEVEYFVRPCRRSVESVFPGRGRVCSAYGGYCMETGDADGGWVATPRDLVTLMGSLEGLAHTRVLSPHSFSLMLSRPRYARGTTCWYGLGLDVAWSGRAWEHGGHIDGATSSVTRSKDGLTWAVCCNSWPADSDYTSLIAYGLLRVSGTLSNFTTHPHVNITSPDRTWAVSIQVPEADIHDLVTVLEGQGYRLSWFSGYQVKDQTFINMIWMNDSTESKCYYDMTAEELDEVVQRETSDGFVPTHVDTYDSCRWRSVRFAVIFVKDDNCGGWILEHSLQLEDLTSRITALEDRNYTIKCQSPYSDSLVCALFHQTDSPSVCWPRHHLSESAYSKEEHRQTRYGHLATYVKCYPMDGQVGFSVVWSHPGPFLYTSEHAMSPYRVLCDVAAVSESGFSPTCICGYQGEDGDHQFVAVCVKPTATRRRSPRWK